MAAADYKEFAAAYPVCEAYTNDALTDEMVESIKDMRPTHYEINVDLSLLVLNI